MSGLEPAPREIVMYARERFCPDVQRARGVLAEHDLSWTEFDIEADREALAQVQAMTGRNNVPTVLIGGEILIEPSKGELEAALIRAGFLEPAR